MSDEPMPCRIVRDLEGRVSIVTGAASRGERIGKVRGASILMAEAGAHVVRVGGSRAEASEEPI